MTEKQKTGLLGKLKVANSKITKSQRQGIWDNVMDCCNKPTFYKIISGKFVANNNIALAKAILKRMNAYILQNGKILTKLTK